MEFALSTQKVNTKSVKDMIECLNGISIEDLEQFLKDNLVQHLEENPDFHVLHLLPYKVYTEEDHKTIIQFNTDLAKVKSIFNFIEKNNLQELVDTYHNDEPTYHYECILNLFNINFDEFKRSNPTFIFMFDKILDMNFKVYPDFVFDMIDHYYFGSFNGPLSDKDIIDHYYYGSFNQPLSVKKNEIFIKILDKKENISEIIKYEGHKNGILFEEKLHFIFSYIAFRFLNDPFSLKPCETYKDFKDYLENEIGIKNHMDLLRCNKEIHDRISNNMKELYKHEYKLCFPQIYTP